MPQTHLKAMRNQTIECAKLMASFFVVFIHCSFPGDFGSAINGLARFAVPMFFAVSGYFSFQAGSRKIRGRVRKTFNLNLICTVLYMVWGYFLAVYSHSSAVDYLKQTIGTVRSLAKWLLYNQNPFGSHLWYLGALLVCYLLFYIFEKCNEEFRIGYCPLYITASVLLAIHFAIEDFSLAVNIELPEYISRNALFLGVPSFCIGVFIREHGERIASIFRLTTVKLLLALCVGAGFSMVQWFGYGHPELPYGAVISVFCLMLLFQKNPELSIRSQAWEYCISKFGALSKSIYILHLLVIDVYNTFLCNKSAALFGNREALFQPILVAILSLAVAILLEFANGFVKYIRKRNRI